jgi:hypothetical protein
MAAEIKIISDQVTLVAFPNWPVPTIALQAGQAGFDLKPTLPTGIPSGGTFGTVAPLPTGLAMTTAGVVSAAAGTPAGSTQGVQFTYTLPA